MPNGEPFEFTILVLGTGRHERPGHDRRPDVEPGRRAGVARSCSQTSSTFGCQAATTRRAVAWAVETWGGHPDLSFFLDSYHSEYIAEPGELQPARNWMRWQNPELDRIIEEIRGIDFNDLEKQRRLGRDFVRLHLQDMPNIPVMSYNVFSAMSERYWTGYPTSENPYTDPVNNWANSRSIFTQISPVGTEPAGSNRSEPNRSEPDLQSMQAGARPLVPGARHRLDWASAVDEVAEVGKAADEGLFVVCAQALHADDRRHLRRGLGGISDQSSLTDQPGRKRSRPNHRPIELQP